MENLESLLTLSKSYVTETYQTLTYDSIKESIVTAPVRYKRWWLHLVEHAPGHVVVETALILFILWLVFLRKTEDPTQEETFLSEKEIDDLVKEWKPEPLTPEVNPDWEKDPNLIIEEMDGNTFIVEGKPLLNFATFDFLGLGARKQVKDTARAALDKYGCGSCGPRGFYGTIDVHVHCEEAIAEFMGAEEAISYSDSASNVSSTLPAFAKKGDLLIVDQGVYEPILTAINLSRSVVKYFKHNDMDDLERVLESVAQDDKRYKRNAEEQRRFIIVEGLYKNFGDLAPLPQLVELKKRYNYRIYLDQTFSFGTCGATGRGLAEHFNIPLSEIDIMSVSMAHTLASVGGLCVGTSEVVDHQRLSGAGYCFSASAPPFVSSAAIAALDILKAEPELVDKLQKNASTMYKGIGKISNLKVQSDELSPIIHVGLDPKLGLDKKEERELLREISKRCIDAGYAIVTSKYKIGETFVPPPTLRITVHATHTAADLKGALDTLKTVTAAVVKGK